MKLEAGLLAVISGISHFVLSYNCGRSQKSLECQQLNKIINSSCIKFGKSKFMAERKCLIEEVNLVSATKCISKICSETDKRMVNSSRFLARLQNSGHNSLSKINKILGLNQEGIFTDLIDGTFFDFPFVHA